MSQSQPFPGQARGDGHLLPHQHSTEFRNGTTNASQPPTNGHVPVPVPVPTNGLPDPLRGAFTGARSPPNSKNTSHVPCKFWRQGQCQAGKACPFLHGEMIGPCKYFQKGNCKFGLRCANEHITQTGQRIDKPSVIQMGRYNIGPRVHPGQIPPGGSLLSMQHEQYMNPQPTAEEYMNMNYIQKSQYEIPTIGTTVSSMPGSPFGSPPNELMLGKSPAVRGLSALDAQLPASFESQGVSYIARHGPQAASVPTSFGIKSLSPPPSLSNHRAMDSSALQNLHWSAYPDDRSIASSVLASSPPNAADDGVGRRIMHSERFSSRPKMLSSSLPRGLDQDWDQSFQFDEDILLPGALTDLLTPEERVRRLSRSGADDSSPAPNHRAALSGLGTPNEATSPKLGSPLGASPSRFGTFFARQQRDRAAADGMDSNNVGSFGHVGSPLRSSLLNPASSPSLRATNGRPTSGDFSMSSPPRHSSGSMGMISQQLQRVRLSSRGSDTNIDSATGTTPSQSSHTPSMAVPIPPGRLQDRSISTASNPGFGRSERIDEEPPLFAMDEVDSDRWKRLSSSNAAGKSAGVIGSPRATSNGGI